MVELTLFFQQLANGLVSGASYILIAIGLTLVMGVLRLVNFAHGELYMLGAYGTFVAMQAFKLPYVPAAILATAGVALFALAANHFFFRPIRREHHFTTLLSSLGLALLLSHGVEHLAGADPKYLISPYADEIVEFAGITLTQQRLLLFAVGLVLILAVYFFIRFTRMGKMIQATAQEPTGAALTGINVDWVHAYTMGLGGALAGAAGAMVAPLTSLLPNVGEGALLKGIIVIVVGGLGSVSGAVAGGLLLGVAESLGGMYISIGFKEAIGYIFIILLLLWRPQGLFAKAR
jgi:branched-chain amino acid transport system permease protein